MNTVNPSEKSVCREIVTKERLYERLNNAIKECEMTIMREETRLDALRHFKRNLDEYFEDAEPKTGHWIDTDEKEEWYDEDFVCSECKGHMLGATDFCPYCGAEMRGRLNGR